MATLPTIEMSNLQIAGEANLAYVTCAYSLPPDTGTELLVFRKHNGKWECVVNSWNSDLPLPS